MKNYLFALLFLPLLGCTMEFHLKEDIASDSLSQSDSNSGHESSPKGVRVSDDTVTEFTDTVAGSTENDFDTQTEETTETGVEAGTETETDASSTTDADTEASSDTESGGEKDSDSESGGGSWTWSLGKDLPYAAGALATAVIDDDIHLMGGGSDWYGSIYYQRHHVYNAVNDTWSRSPVDIPDAGTWGAQAHVYNGKIYLLGGFNEGAKLLRVFDPACISWEKLSPIPAAFNYGFVSAVVDEKLYIIGGFENSATNGPVYAFDLVGEKWEARAEIPQNRGEGALAGAAVGTKIYVLSGDGAGGGTILQVYNTTADSWSTGTGLKGHFEAAAAAALGGKIYFFGGATDHDVGSVDVKDAVNIYEPQTDSWSTGPSMPTPRMFPSAVVMDGAFHVFGGFDSHMQGLSAHEVLYLQ